VLQTQTNNLPQDQQQRLHLDFVANEQAYLLMREELLAQYRGQWVAVHNGQVLAAGPKLMEVMEGSSRCGGRPYVALVGGEDAVVFRVRRAVFAYDHEIDGTRYAALIQPISAGRERIVGRDVLNQQRVLFNGPAGQVVVEP
jgi:hypothetical protein